MKWAGWAYGDWRAWVLPEGATTPQAWPVFVVEDSGQCGQIMRFFKKSLNLNF